MNTRNYCFDKNPTIQFSTNASYVDIGEFCNANGKKV
jgi:hypothetical protein